MYNSSVLFGRRTELESFNIVEKVAENSPFRKSGFSPMFLNNDGRKDAFASLVQQLLLRSKNRKQTVHVQ